MLERIKEIKRNRAIRKSSDEVKALYLPENAEGFDDFYFTVESHSNKTYVNNIYRDGHKSLVLYDEIPGKAVALVGFESVGLESIMVVQLQARLGIEKENLPKRWERTLLEAGINYAREQGFSQIQVQPSTKNTWIKMGTSKSDKAHNLRLKMRYDVTAKRRGFKLDESLDAWVLDL